MQQEVMAKIHAGHQGVTKCQLRAKNAVYWPGINKNIAKLGCNVCQEHQRTQTPEPLMLHPMAHCGNGPILFCSAEYLIIADYYSKSMFIRKVNGPCSSAAVVSLTKQIFSEQGIATKVVSDNGPQYDSREYRKDWEFDHVTSSPRFPQSNGFIERMI